MHLYDTSYIQKYLRLGILEPGEIYPIPMNVLQEFLDAYKDKSKLLISINRELKISKSFPKWINYQGVFFLGSPELINDLIEMFAKYYSNKIPSKKESIKKFLICFGELIKLTEGKLLQELRWPSVKNKLNSVVDKNFVEILMNKVIIEDLYE